MLPPAALFIVHTHGAMRAFSSVLLAD